MFSETAKESERFVFLSERFIFFFSLLIFLAAKKVQKLQACPNVHLAAFGMLASVGKLCRAYTHHHTSPHITVKLCIHIKPVPYIFSIYAICLLY